MSRAAERADPADGPDGLDETGSLDQPDVDLIASMATGDLAAFGSLYRRHASLAYGLALRMTGDATRAEDVVQSAFLSLWKAPDESDGDVDAVRRQLVQLVARGSLVHLRRQRRFPDAIGSRAHLAMRQRQPGLTQSR